MMPNDRAIALGVFLAVLAATFAAGFLTADRMNRDQIVPPTERGEVRHGDGTVTVARQPDARPKLPAPKTPAGSTPHTTVEVTVQPRDVYLPATDTCPAQTVECPPVRLRLDLVRESTGQYTVAAKTPDGEILEAVHIPHTAAVMPRDKRLAVTWFPDNGWAASATQDAGRWAYGVAGGEIDGSRYAGLTLGVAW